MAGSTDNRQVRKNALWNVVTTYRAISGVWNPTKATFRDFPLAVFKTLQSVITNNTGPTAEDDFDDDDDDNDFDDDLLSCNKYSFNSSSVTFGAKFLMHTRVCEMTGVVVALVGLIDDDDDDEGWTILLLPEEIKL